MYKELLKYFPSDIVNIITEYITGDTEYWKKKFTKIVNVTSNYVSPNQEIMFYGKMYLIWGGNNPFIKYFRFMTNDKVRREGMQETYNKVCVMLGKKPEKLFKKKKNKNKRRK